MKPYDAIYSVQKVSYLFEFPQPPLQQWRRKSKLFPILCRTSIFFRSHSLKLLPVPTVTSALNATTKLSSSQSLRARLFRRSRLKFPKLWMRLRLRVLWSSFERTKRWQTRGIWLIKRWNALICCILRLMVRLWMVWRRVIVRDYVEMWNVLTNANHKKKGLALRLEMGAFFS